MKTARRDANTVVCSGKELYEMFVVLGIASCIISWFTHKCRKSRNT